MLWTTCGVCVLNVCRIIVSGRRIICPLQWGFVIEVEANLISTPVSNDAITVMACQFCDVIFVYGESLQWGFGFASYCFIGCVIESREEHLCFWSGPLGLVMTHQMLFLRWFICVPMVWGWVWLRIHQTLVSEVDSFCWVSLSLLVGIHQTFGFWNGSFKCSWLTLKWIIVVVRTFSCWSDFNMRASVKHELLGHGFHDELFN